MAYHYRENIMADLTFLDALHEQFTVEMQDVGPEEDEDLWVMLHRLKPAA